MTKAKLLIYTIDKDRCDVRKGGAIAKLHLFCMVRCYGDTCLLLTVYDIAFYDTTVCITF